MKTNHAEPPKPPRRKNRGQWKLPPCCLSCEKPGTLEEHCVPTVQEIRGEEVAYETMKWVCRECSAAFMSPAQANQGVKLAVRAYQQKHGRLTAEEIRENRAALGMSAAELAEAAGIGEATVKRLEAGATVQQKSTDKLLRGLFAEQTMELEYESHFSILLDEFSSAEFSSHYDIPACTHNADLWANFPDLDLAPPAIDEPLPQLQAA